jgi:hypothetical protein
MGPVGSIPELETDPHDPDSSPEPRDLPSLVEAYERSVILASLAAAEGHQRRAARMLGIGPTTLNQKLKRLQLRGVSLQSAAPASSPGPRPPSAEPPAASNEFRWRGRLPSGYGLDVRSVNGDITAEAGVGNEVEVLAQKRNDPSGPGGLSVDIVVTESELGLCITAQYVSGSGKGSPPHVEGLGPRQPRGPDDLRVNFRILMPRAANLDARTLNGDIEVRGLSGRIRAWSARGSVSVDADRPR